MTISLLNSSLEGYNSNAKKAKSPIKNVSYIFGKWKAQKKLNGSKI